MIKHSTFSQLRAWHALIAGLLTGALVMVGFELFRQISGGPDLNAGLVACGCLAVAGLLRDKLSKRRFESYARSSATVLKEVKEKNRLLNLTAATAKVGHWRIRLDTDEIFWSAETFKIHGLEPGSPPKLEDAINFFHPEDRDIVNEAVEGSRSSGEPYHFNARLIRADGEIRHTESSALVELNPNGEPEALFGVFRDRTDDEILHSELRAARDEANRMAEAKSAFLAKMSHEIRTPMNGVIGFAELLSLSDVRPEQKRHIDLILDSGRSLQTLLSDILDLSKIEAGKIEIRSDTTDLPQLLQRIAQLNEPLARERAIVLELSVEPDLPRYVKLDALRLRQILSNLASNAIKFTDRGKVTIRARNDADRLVFDVTDTGIGIAADRHGEIFDAFAQGHKQFEGREVGTGLGLTISHQLAYLMDGTLNVESAIGKGSTFTLSLPKVLAPTPINVLPLVAPKPLNPCADCSCRILLAEDYDINQELICEMGKRIGLSFEIAEDGSVAVEKVIAAQDSSQPYSLVLMDLQMPNMGGIAASRAIREAGIDAETLPIIALTANAFADDVAACLEAGMQEHVAKPVELTKLEEVMRRWLSGYVSETSGANECAKLAINSKLHAAAGSSKSRQHCRRF